MPETTKPETEPKKNFHIAYRGLERSPIGSWRKTEIVDPRNGVVAVTPPGKKVLIYGAGLHHRQAPLDDESWEVWCINLIPALDSMGKLRADRWFDIHQRLAQTDDDLKWIGEVCPVPIYVPEDLLDAGPRCVRFPHERIIATFGSANFACSFAYQIALALYEGYKTIGLFGVELPYGTRRERTVEWASVAFWMGYATACGVHFVLPQGSRLAQHPFLYGIQYKEEIEDVEKYLKVLASYGTAERDSAADGPNAIDGGYIEIEETPDIQPEDSDGQEDETV